MNHHDDAVAQQRQDETNKATENNDTSKIKTDDDALSATFVDDDDGGDDDRTETEESFGCHRIDDKSIFRMAYDLIDQTSRILARPFMNTQSGSEVPHDHMDSNLERGDEKQLADFHHGMSPVVARAQAKAVSAYVSSSCNGHQQRSSPVVPGAEYVRYRAPGLSPSLYLRVVRRNNLRRAREALEASERQASVNHESAGNLSLPVGENPQIEIVAVTASGDNDINTTAKSDRSRCWVVAGATFLVLVLVGGLGLGIALYLVKHRQAGNIPLATTHFDPLTWNCTAVDGQVNPHVVSQCYCHNRIAVVANDIIARYDQLKTTLFTPSYPYPSESLDSCNPRNQALVWLASASGTPTTDANLLQRYILATLFTSWNGLHWMVTDGWMSSNMECTWKGVSCNRLGEVIGIDLYNNNVSGNLGTDFTQLTALTALYLSENGMNGSIPSEVGGLADLSSLDLSSNLMTGTIPIEITQLSHLTQLQMGSNKLSGMIPTWIGQLSNLQILSLSNNTFISQTIPTEIGSLTKLQMLSLSQTGLTGSLPSELFAQLGNTLQNLQLGYNSLSGSIPRLVGNLGVVSTWLPDGGAM